MNRNRWLGNLLLVGLVTSPAMPAPTGREVPGQYPSIQAAIDAAADGDRITIAAGRYDTPLVIRGKHLILEGGGSGVTRLTAAAVSGGEGADGLPVTLSPFLSLEEGATVRLDRVSLDLGGFDVGVRVAGGPAAAPPLGLDAFQLVLTNGCLVGSNQPGAIGLLVDGTGGPARVKLERMIVHSWDVGIRTLGAGAYVEAQDCALTPNLTAVIDNTGSGAAQDARNNWWGSATGPAGAGPGSGDAVIGPGVAFHPWRLSGADTDVACGFNPPPDNVVTPIPPDSCLSTAYPCLTVPVWIQRTDNASMRAWSVTFQLSPELALCGGPGSIAEGDYLSDANPATDFHVIDNGGGSYTVDDAILGLPCGQEDPTGILFSIPVTHTGSSGTGTITIGTVLLRDCANQPIDGTAGPAVPVEIDITPTGPVTALLATPVLTGNDSDGTIRIDLAFTPPAGAAGVEVWRAPFGNYPEYDDAPGAGSVPAPPGYPPSPPWTPTSVTTSGQDDEVTARDVWYFTAFAVDSCGNVSAASNMTTGTLNYHLGDVHDGLADCSGDNLVGTTDVSYLGANYGVLLAPSDPLACLDIGPTLDFSSLARPTTDNVIDFEDQITMALDYGLVSRPQVVSRSTQPVSLGATAAPAAGVHLQFVAVPTTILPGDTFLVQVTVPVADAQFNAFDLVIEYDPDRLTFVPTSPVSNQRGALMTGACANTFHQFTPVSGQLTTVLSLLCNGVFVTGPGVIYQVRFAAGDTVGTTEIRCGAGTQFYRAGFFVNPLDCATAMIEITGTSGVDPTPASAVLSLAARSDVAGNGVVDLQFELPADTSAEFAVFDILGRRLAFRGAERFSAGRHRVSWAVPSLPSGLHVVRLVTGSGARVTARMLTLR
jgi:hypothetical protein